MTKEHLLYEKKELEEEIEQLRRKIKNYRRAVGFLMLTALVLLWFGMLPVAFIILLLVILAQYIINDLYQVIESKERELLEKDLRGFFL